MYKARLTLLKNKDVHKQFLESPNRKNFREEHSAEIMLNMKPIPKPVLTTKKCPILKPI